MPVRTKSLHTWKSLLIASVGLFRETLHVSVGKLNYHLIKVELFISAFYLYSSFYQIKLKKFLIRHPRQYVEQSYD